MSHPGVETYERFERNWNRLQNGIEGGIIVVVLLGLAGAFGSGLLSRREETASPALSVSYDRILRRTEMGDIVIDLAGSSDRTAVTIGVPQAFLDHEEITSTSPRAAGMSARQGGLDYVFDVAGSAGGRIVLATKAKGFGLARSELTIANTPVGLTQLILP